MHLVQFIVIFRFPELSEVLKSVTEKAVLA